MSGQMKASVRSVQSSSVGKPNRGSPPLREAGFYAHRHLAFGWWALFIFLSMGILLEVLHALKVGWYLDVSNETRRLMWTLGHAHGTLLALINIAFASTVAMLNNLGPKLRSAVSGCLLAATVLVPGGFILGGLVIHSGDPGLGILLLPIGALLLLTGVFLVARSNTFSPRKNGLAKPISNLKAREKEKEGIEH